MDRTMIKVDSCLTGGDYESVKLYEINGSDYCPKCNGVIIRDFNDAVCLNCGLREINEVAFLTYLEEQMIQWLIRNLPRQLFATLDFLNQNIIDDETTYIKIPSYNGVIASHVESFLLQLAGLEQRGVIRIHPHGVISDYDCVIVVYDILDRDKIDQRLIPTGIL